MVGLEVTLISFVEIYIELGKKTKIGMEGHAILS